jgi:methyltransferase (TIGR00027 family)
MFEALKRVRYQVQDLEQAKQWYSGLLGKHPVLDAPFAVAFLVGDAVLMLAPASSARRAIDERVVAYWGVSNIDQARSRLLECGAEPRGEVTSFGDTRFARVVDPFGNVVGITEKIVDVSSRAVENQASESALVTAYCRALAARHERQEMRGPDYLAELFLNESGRASLKERASREWAITRVVTPGLYDYLSARTSWLDGVFSDALGAQVPQIVFLGAGYDTRSFCFRDLIGDTRIFEADAPTTQNRKRSILEKAQIEVPEQVRFVPVNFNADSLTTALGQSGFDSAAQTLFIWEGVVYYLKVDAVDRTLEFVARNSAPGSSVCFDYMTQALPSAHAAEPFQFWIASAEMESFLAARGFGLAEHFTAPDIESAFLTLPDGKPAGRSVPFFCFVRACVR